MLSLTQLFCGILNHNLDLRFTIKTIKLNGFRRLTKGIKINWNFWKYWDVTVNSTMYHIFGSTK